jgi:hypothetical protein
VYRQTGRHLGNRSILSSCAAAASLGCEVVLNKYEVESAWMSLT